MSSENPRKCPTLGEFHAPEGKAVVGAAGKSGIDRNREVVVN